MWTADREGAVAADSGAAVFGNGVYISDYYNDRVVHGAHLVKFISPPAPGCTRVRP